MKTLKSKLWPLIIERSKYWLETLEILSVCDINDNDPYQRQIPYRGFRLQNVQELIVFWTTCLAIDHCLVCGRTLEWSPRPENLFFHKVERSLPRKRMVSSQICRIDVQTVILQRACLCCPDSKATKVGGKAGSYKPFNKAEKMNKPWTTADPFNKQNRFLTSTADGGSQKRKKPPKKGGEGEGADFKFSYCLVCFDLLLFTTNLQTWS